MSDICICGDEGRYEGGGELIDPPDCGECWVEYIGTGDDGSVDMPFTFSVGVLADAEFSAPLVFALPSAEAPEIKIHSTCY